MIKTLDGFFYQIFNLIKEMEMKNDS